MYFLNKILITSVYLPMFTSISSYSYLPISNILWEISLSQSMSVCFFFNFCLINLFISLSFSLIKPLFILYTLFLETVAWCQFYTYPYYIYVGINTIWIFTSFKTYFKFQCIDQMSRVFANGPGNRSYQRLKKWYLMPPFLTFCIIR